jgi:hypothetical protein
LTPSQSSGSAATVGKAAVAASKGTGALMRISVTPSVLQERIGA